MVTRNISSIRNFSELRYFVYQTLCQDHELLMNAFPTSETVLRRGNMQKCGIMFCLYGPRAVKFTAIWENENNRVFFYGPNGKRYMQIELSEVKLEEEDSVLNN